MFISESEFTKHSGTPCVNSLIFCQSKVVLCSNREVSKDLISWQVIDFSRYGCVSIALSFPRLAGCNDSADLIYLATASQKERVINTTTNFLNFNGVLPIMATVQVGENNRIRSVIINLSLTIRESKLCKVIVSPSIQ
jgi:hypothetical protein